jgi:hypothetical protein
MPAQALWGYISYSEDTERLLAEQQLAELDEFTTPLGWSAGYYGHFDLEEDGTFGLAERLLPSEAVYVPFLVQYDEPASLASWLQSTQAQLSAGMSLRVFNGVGEEWVY